MTLSHMLASVFREEDAEVIYKDAMMLNLTDTGYAWIVTEQALNPSNTPPGTFTVKPH